MPKFCLAAAFASASLASPFNASFVLVTCCNAWSTAALSEFDPVCLFKIAFAAATAWS